MSLSAKNGWLDEQGRVYIIYTVREVQESLCCAEHKVVKLFRELEDIELIERKRRGPGSFLCYAIKNDSNMPVDASDSRHYNRSMAKSIEEQERRKYGA